MAHWKSGWSFRQAGRHPQCWIPVCYTLQLRSASLIYISFTEICCKTIFWTLIDNLVWYLGVITVEKCPKIREAVSMDPMHTYRCYWRDAHSWSSYVIRTWRGVGRCAFTVFIFVKNGFLHIKEEILSFKIIPCPNFFT